MFLGSMGNPIQDMGVYLAVLSHGFLEELYILQVMHSGAG